MRARVEERLRQAVEWHRQGDLVRAETAYLELLQEEPQQPDALHLLGVVLTQAGRSAQGAEYMQRSLRAQPDQPIVHANLGNALAALGQNTAALAAYDRALASLPDYAPALNGRGNVLSKLGVWQEAVTSYRRALALMPNLIETHTNLGLALSRLERWSDALECYGRALTLAPHHVNALIGQGHAWLALNECNEAGNAFEQVLATNRQHTAALTGRGQVLLAGGRNAEALADFEAALRIQADQPPVLFLRGRALMQLGRPAAAAACFRRVWELDPAHEYALGARLWSELHACSWGDHAALIAQIVEGVTQGRAAAFPFVFFSVCDSPQLQLRCAREFAARIRPHAQPLWTGERYRHDRIRVAYISEDFRSHPTAYLMMGLWERHDRRRFEVIAVSLRPEEDSAVGRRIKPAFERFIDAGALGDAQLARRIRELEVDIAVDLMGYTGGSARTLLAHRPAPIQVNYLGYPGTLGSPDADYLIADEFLVPESEKRHFTEHIVYLPGTYQPNDDRRPMIDAAPSRADAGLPPDAFVWCSFNNGYKLNPAVVGTWCQLLRAVPDSVLWLMSSATESAANLRAEFAAHDVDPGRVIFAPSLPNPEHVARIALADLCLDTGPVNGATTTSDALWAGVPVLTCAGRSFVSRMAGSVLTGVGLPELITADWHEYEELALCLARDPPRLAQLRAKLARVKAASALFDTDRYRRNLEAAFIGMWERHQRGEPPRSFKVDEQG